MLLIWTTGLDPPFPLDFHEVVQARVASQVSGQNLKLLNCASVAKLMLLVFEH